MRVVLGGQEDWKSVQQQVQEQSGEQRGIKKHQPPAATDTDGSSSGRAASPRPRTRLFAKGVVTSMVRRMGWNRE